ncbi:MAG: efflux RND transporter periplasmic adaptor subunit [Chthoniobacterales bacterium]
MNIQTENKTDDELANRKKVIRRSVAITVAVIVGLLGFKGFQIWGLMHMKFEMPPEAVTSMTVKEEEWKPVLKAVGSLQAVNGVVVTSDLPGMVAQIAFESGAHVKKGDLLVQIDTRQEQTQMASAQAKLKLTELNMQRTNDLYAKRVSAKSDYDAVVAEYQQALAHMHEMQAAIDRKTIRAPFDGVLGIREVNVGEYIESGKKVVPLQSLDPIYVNFAVPQQFLESLKIGATVDVKVKGIGDENFKGTLNAINSMVDESTRNIQVQGTICNTNDKLRPGMFVDIDVPMPVSHVIVIPSSSISYAPYGNSVYVIEDTKGPDGKISKTVKQVFVKTGQTRGDQIAILSGLRTGQEVVTSGVFKLRNGAKVLVNNDIKVPNDPNPKPEDT